MIQKTKSIKNIEARMENIDPGSFRYKTLEAAKNFKSSWLELGSYLFTVYKDKRFKEWGYLTFEAYSSKEIGIRQATAVKLLKSYSFLERDEPAYLRRGQTPSLESVNALRLAKTKEGISEEDYETLREDVLNRACEEGDVKKKIRYLLNSAPRLQGENREERKSAVVKKLITQLEHSKTQMSGLEFPPKVLKQLDALIEILKEGTWTR